MPQIKFKQCHSGNYTAGRGGCAIDHIVIHYTGGTGTAAQNATYFSSRSGIGASAHYFLDGSGTIWQSVADGDRAWHAGDWNMNCHSIGIETVSNGEDFSAAEIAELAWLTKSIMARYGIPASRVIRHYDVTGKLCPAPYVDAAKWAKLHAAITGGAVPAPAPTPAHSAPSGLTVDGWWGPATTKALQKVLGTPQDGVVSSQSSHWKAQNPALQGGWEWVAPASAKGSTVIRAMQRKIGVTADGLVGPATFKALQKRMGTTQDGVLSAKSACVMALQKRLNAGQF